jgi:ABC-type lipoprotein release transport system permease subunit
MNTLKTLMRRYGRTSLTVTGVALAIAFSTIMLSIGTAIQESSEELIEETGVDLLVEPADLAPLIQEIIPIFKIDHARTLANSMINNNSKIRAASPWLVKNMYVAKHPDIINASKPPKFALLAAKGSIPENNRYFGGVKIIEGTELPTITDPFYANGTYQGGIHSNNFTHEILISKELARLLDISVGELIYLNPVGIFNDFTNQSIEDWFIKGGHHHLPCSGDIENDTGLECPGWQAAATVVVAPEHDRCSFLILCACSKAFQTWLSLLRY